MERFIELLAGNTVTMSLLIISCLAMTSKLQKKFRAKGIYYAWLIIVLGLIIPFRLHFDIILQRVVSEPVYIYNYEPEDENALLLTGMGSKESISISWYQIIGAVWFIGVIVFISFQSMRHYRFIKMLNRWGEENTSSYEYKLLQKIRKDMNISKPVRLLVGTCVSSPMQIGFINPVIMLPEMNLSKDELSLIFRHELIHFRRKDLWYKGLVVIATAIHWYNPLVYIMGKAIGEVCEISCDNEVIKNSDTDKRIQYCETIIGMMQQHANTKTVFSSNFTQGMRGINKRIHAIMDRKEKKTGIAIICMTLIGIMLSGLNFSTVAEGTVIYITVDMEGAGQFGEYNVSTINESTYTIAE